MNLPGVYVWAGIHARGLDRYFIDNTVIRQTYLEMLEDLCEQMDEDPELANIVHFMQDGASPHYVLILHQFLDACFGEWIGRRGKIE
jgi:hypothetical protein